MLECTTLSQNIENIEAFQSQLPWVRARCRHSARARRARTFTLRHLCLLRRAQIKQEQEKRLHTVQYRTFCILFRSHPAFHSRTMYSYSLR